MNRHKRADEQTDRQDRSNTLPERFSKLVAKKENYCKRSKLTKHQNGLEFFPLEGDIRCPPRCDLCLGIGSIASVAASLTQSPAKQSVFITRSYINP